MLRPHFTPEIPDPYPAKETARVTDFRYEGSLSLRRFVQAAELPDGEAADFVLSEDYVVSYKIGGERARRKLTVPKGMLTDLSSVPPILSQLTGIGRTGRHLEASIVHDFLYLAWQDIPGRKARKQDWRFANAVMVAAMETSGVRHIHRVWIRGAIESDTAWHVYATPNRSRYVEL